MQVCLSLEFQDGVHHLLDSKIRAAAGEDDGGVAGEKKPRKKPSEDRTWHAMW